MAKKDNSTVSALSIVTAFFIALLIEFIYITFGTISAIGAAFSDVLFSILYSICVILLFMPVLRRHRPKRFSWKVFLVYVVPGFIIIFLELPTDHIIIPLSGALFESLTLTRLIAAILIGVGVVRAIVTGSKERKS